MLTLIHDDVLAAIGRLDKQNMTFGCCFMDPPDAIGLKLNGYCERPADGYMDWLGEVIDVVLPICSVTWVSYNVIWDLDVKSWAKACLAKNPDLEIKPFVWTYTFGQNRKTDCGPGHRPILRFRWKDAPLYPDQIKVPSWRQLNGDKRAAAGGRVPLDAWSEFPRVVGNSKERRPWHPTQHPEGLVERAIRLSTPDPVDPIAIHAVEPRVLDLFAGTGTCMRVCKRIQRDCISVELNKTYVKELVAEHGLRKTSEKIWES
jgi:hypothetical protein